MALLVKLYSTNTKQEYKVAFVMLSDFLYHLEFDRFMTVFELC